MAAEESRLREFGCERCWPDSADAAHEARQMLKPDVQLIDESHFHVDVRKCPACSQHFVSMFAETIDWVNGEDPQYWTLLPVSPAEVAALVERGDSLGETDLNSLGHGRRSLHRDFPSDSPARSFWSAGLLVPPHD
jgi:hypothetical protein